MAPRPPHLITPPGLPLTKGRRILPPLKLRGGRGSYDRGCFELLHKAVTRMDQENLREWESKCIQEEPPECTAACPIHVDARLFVKEMGQGDVEAAFKVLAKTMPFPGILGRICDHPCELRCKRGEVEAPIAIGLLERHCVEHAAGKNRIQLLSRRSQRVAVIGGGFAGLCAAWDLLKKGFLVTVF